MIKKEKEENIVKEEVGVLSEELVNYFITIKNRSNFLLKGIPTLHPKSGAYLAWWKLHKQRCIEGFWSQDDAEVTVDVDSSLPKAIRNIEGGWRFMPGNLYFYVNFGTIMHQDPTGPKTAPKKAMRPFLRDVEWEFFYNWLEARGFSGFADDDVYTCDRAVVNAEEDEFIEIGKDCYNSKGELKEYIDARDYLKQIHLKPLGIPLYENEARNLFMLGSRGFGKSFMVGGGVILPELLFDGAQAYTKESRENPFKVEIFVGAAISSKSADILNKTKEGLNSLPGGWGEGTRSAVPAPFSKIMAGSLAPNNMKKPWEHRYSKKIGGIWRDDCGTGSNIKHGLYTTANPEAAAGTRPGVMVVEEVGLLPNVLTVHGSNTACQLEGSWKFGSTVYLGTGGNVEKIMQSEIIFRDPEGFDFTVFPDIWEGSGKLGWFVPAIYALNQFKDENGNTDVFKSTRFLNKIRAKKKKSKDVSALALEMMNRPMVPSEMFLNAKGAMFPQVELKEHLAHIVTHPKQFIDSHWHGELVWDDKGKLKWVAGESAALERTWPITSNKNRPGTIEIYEMPKKDAQGDVYSSRYLQGTDTYDDDESNTSSLGSTWILDSLTDRVVAEYTGRRGTKAFYEVTRKLNIFYRSAHNYEQNKKGLYAHYDNKNSVHLLCDTPESLKDVADISISKVGNKRKGTTASAPVNAYGLRLILDWLMTPAYGAENQEILNLHTIKSPGLLLELISYNEDGNFDRVSGMIMLMILREDKLKYAFKKQQAKVETLLEDDDFFNRNYGV
tara:strand:+ start:11577 stop:13919 length:2343 start_codon:yes stop_codon:yes gene_type:complete